MINVYQFTLEFFAFSGDNIQNKLQRTDTPLLLSWD